MYAQSSASPGKQSVPPVLQYLTQMTRRFVVDGVSTPFIYIYARPLTHSDGTDLEFITARESGFEGIACVDDVARAAMLALQSYEQTHATAALETARDWLTFVEYMQESDGRFTNFIVDESGAKNMRGRTSRTGGKWWTGRAMWALAMAWRVTGDDRYLNRFMAGRLTPAGNDLKIKALQALALLELYRVRPDDALRARIGALCDAIVASGNGYFVDHKGVDHVALWGYHQLAAVATAADLLSRVDYVSACEQTVHTLIEPVVDEGFYHIYPVERDHQCAYDISTLVLGLEALYRVTRKEHHRDLALRCASWLDGNNPAGAKMYDARTGRCSDGISNGVASQNCGAESAIEAGFAELARARLRAKARRGVPRHLRLVSGA